MEQAPLLFACCVWVHGTDRSFIYDLQQQRGISLPGAYSDLMALLECRRGAILGELLAPLDERDRGRLLGLLQFLIDQGLLFCTGTPDRFPRLSLRWSRPSVLLSAVLDVDMQSDHDLEGLLSELESLGCERLAVRLRVEEPLRWLEELLIQMKGGRGMTLEVFLEAGAIPDVAGLLELCTRETRIATLHLMGADHHEIVQWAPSGFGSILRHTRALDLDACEAPSRADHQISLELFCESQCFNTFTHRKVCISTRGLLRNSVGNAPSFGDLHRDRLAAVVETPDFQAAWFVHKGMIRECRDCELRHMCIDPRLPVNTGEGDFIHTTPCRYGRVHGA